MEAVLRETDFKNLGPKTQGKVRDIYEQEHQLILISTDRHSSFDRIIAYIPGKGEVLNRTSAFWFDHTQDIIQNHVFATPDPNVTVAKKCKPLAIEVVMRGYLTGVTGTSLWTHYKGGKRDFGNFTLPEGMQKNERLSEPVFTPSTKEKEHDRTVTPQEILTMGLLEKDMLEKVEHTARALFARGQQMASKQGLILVDTKYEMGVDENGALTLIDEIHTPDSSRYWQSASYEARFAQGAEPEYFDKEFLRLWFMEHCDPYKDVSLPQAPKEMVAELSLRYATIFNQLTGNTVTALGSTGNIEERIQKNLMPYVL